MLDYRVMIRFKFKYNVNVRDIGGIPISFDNYTKFHQFIRAEVPLQLTNEEIKFLSEYGVKVIVDLRNEYEVNKKPNQLAKHKDFKYYNLPILQFDNSKDSKQSTLRELYFEFLEYGPAIKRFYEIIYENKDSAILFHCSFGKDRTGFFAAQLLSLVNVDRLDILADYDASGIFVQPLVDQLLATNQNVNHKNYLTYKDYLNDLLDHIDKIYGSMQGFLLSIGVKKEHIQCVKDKLGGGTWPN
jgi:protein-tyrosine phosphatase